MASQASAGVYLQFESDSDHDLALKSLDLPSLGVQLRAVRDIDGQQIATVFVPERSIARFAKKFEDYVNENDSRWGTPKNRLLAESIKDIHLATVRSFWTDTDDQFPGAGELAWWEVWLDGGDESAEAFRAFAEREGLQIGQRALRFVDRVVVLVYCVPEQMAKALEQVDALAELRRAKHSARFFQDISTVEQHGWSDALLARTTMAGDDAPAVCILDSGVTNSHPLLADSLATADCHVAVTGWPSQDRDGHGTEMAGLALWGDLASTVESAHPIQLHHRLESAKIYDEALQSADPELFGAITLAGVSLTEVQAPHRQRVFGLAVTADDKGRDNGSPSSWSAALDNIAAGVDTADEHRRLILVSAGNNRPANADEYPDALFTSGVHDPAQSWNAVTVGAMTELDRIEETALDGWEPLAEVGDVAPMSTSSASWEAQWPIKPEIVMEGGNFARSPGGDIDAADSLSVLTTHSRPDQRLFATTNGTSAACATAAGLAADIVAQYPTAWAETIRGLVVHSARWTPAMLQKLGGVAGMTQRERLVRVFGFGVPSRERALKSAASEVTLVAERAIQPYKKDGSRTKMNHLHLHDLPWPREALLALGEHDVRLRVTLSYFVEANPARRGWAHRHRYASHALRFDVKRSSESVAQFGERMLKLARDEDAGSRATAPGDDWYLGYRARHRGSIHQDILTVSAAELASQGMIGIAPVVGWWREAPSHGRYDDVARYSLIVSIETDAQEVDLYQEVLANIRVPVQVAVETE
ncbi:MAG: hypothetical protein JWL76_1476 [Thermoleophilia bacterium]|nr:hypothetical protein [Thermoleophilia bacterium]